MVLAECAARTAINIPTMTSASAALLPHIPKTDRLSPMRIPRIRDASVPGAPVPETRH
jgi:hypothetical protein